MIKEAEKDAARQEKDEGIRENVIVDRVLHATGPTDRPTDQADGQKEYQPSTLPELGSP